ncbi:MAG TPA: hypothetical protein VFV65_04035 [Gemmatimonadales bacterium]|nr:hypothetical protein [Gemmatimonadales bacterium]
MPDTHPRLRFAEFRLDRLPSGRCSAAVVLTSHTGARYEGEAQGLASQAGELRCAAQACITALTQSVEGQLSFECLGVKAIRAFDATVVIVSLATQGEGAPKRVVGSVLTEDDPTRAAALAVLNATNRLLGHRYFVD